MLKKMFLSSAILLLASGCGMLDRTNSGNISISDYKQEMQNSFDTIFFRFDNSGLSKDEMKKLDFQVDYLNKHGNSNIKITGFCDERGTREYNIALGERRANTVKEYLVEKGISSSRVVVDSLGKDLLRCDTTNPIYNVVEGDSDIYHKQNRRALIITEDSTVNYDVIANQERGRCLSPYHAKERNNSAVVTQEKVVDESNVATVKYDSVQEVTTTVSEEMDDQSLSIATEVCDRE